MKRPTSFADIKGHAALNDYFIEHLKDGTLPHFIILHGDTGCGKTSYADLLSIYVNYGFQDSSERDAAIENVIINNRSTDCIKKYDLSVDSGKPAALQIKSELSSIMTSTGKKFIIGDEAQRLNYDAQDVFLVETEYLSKNVYFCLCTTSLSNLQEPLLSRAFIIPVNKIKQSEVVELLKTECQVRGLELQGGVGTLELIANWAQCRPRQALQMIDGLGMNRKVPLRFIQELTDSCDYSDVVQLLAALNQTITFGLEYIVNSKFNDTIYDILVDILLIINGHVSYRVSIADQRNIRTQLAGIPSENIETFIAELSDTTKPTMTRAFIKAHIKHNKIVTHTNGVIKQEIAEKSERAGVANLEREKGVVPTFDSLLRQGTIMN